MDTRSNITRSVKYLMRAKGMTNMTMLADAMGVAREYMPNKMRDSRWTMEDIDRLTEIFNVEPAAIISGTGSVTGWNAARSAQRRAYEITFHLEDGETRKCLEVAGSAREGVNAITSSWDPGIAIKQITTEEKDYFSVHIAQSPATPAESSVLLGGENGDSLG